MVDGERFDNYVRLRTHDSLSRLYIWLKVAQNRLILLQPPAKKFMLSVSPGHKLWKAGPGFLTFMGGLFSTVYKRKGVRDSDL